MPDNLIYPGSIEKLKLLGAAYLRYLPKDVALTKRASQAKFAKASASPHFSLSDESPPRHRGNGVERRS
jgi:hypothetical protein